MDSGHVEAARLMFLDNCRFGQYERDDDKRQPATAGD
jgi:hypothetical protein